MSSKEWKEQNKDKLRESRRKYYQANKETEKARINARTKELAAWLQDYKSTLSCAVCGENHPATLDFHHRDPSEKETTVAGIANRKGWSKERILSEIAKCDVLCANCHRKLHYDTGHTSYG